MLVSTKIGILVLILAMTYLHQATSDDSITNVFPEDCSSQCGSISAKGMECSESELKTSREENVQKKKGNTKDFYIALMECSCPKIIETPECSTCLIKEGAESAEWADVVSMCALKQYEKVGPMFFSSLGLKTPQWEEGDDQKKETNVVSGAETIESNNGFGHTLSVLFLLFLLVAF